MTNQNQQAVIEADNTPLLVVAGPGSGKTYVLEQRVRRLLDVEPDGQFRILAITFTNVAAANLRRRVEDLSGRFDGRLEIGTFHAFAARVLQQHGSHIGLSPDFSIISADEDRAAIASEALKSIGVFADVASILPLVARRYEHGLPVGNDEALVDTNASQPYIFDLTRAYRDISVARGQLDFSLLIYLVLELLTKYAAIGRLLRKIYRYICVDEFQDTNDGQFQLITLLAAQDARGLLFLADQDQVIYEWNGASPRRLREAQDRFQMNVIVLPTSYRCPPLVLDAANRLIAHNSQRFASRHLEADRKGGGRVYVHSLGSEAEEAAWIVSELEKECDPDEVAVLARSRSVLERIARSAHHVGVRAAIPTTRFEFESAPVSMLHSMLRLANISENTKALYRLTGTFFQITGRQIDPNEIQAEATSVERSSLSVFFQRMRPLAVTDEFMLLEKAVQDELVERRQFRNVSALFFAWIDRIASATDWAKTAYLATYNEERTVWNEFELSHRGLISDNVPLGEFLRELDFASKAQWQGDTIRLLTVHAAKGLEFRSVYIAGATDGQFPAFQAVKLGDRSEAMEEERRSFFVAITRSRDQVIVTYPNVVRGYSAEPSRFIKEMGPL